MTAIKVSEVSREELLAAVEEGRFGQVVVFCDVCGIEMETEMIGDDSAERIEGAKAWLRTHRGWVASEGQDICPFCEAGIRMCAYTSHVFCEHQEWVQTPEGPAVHPDDKEKFDKIFVIALKPSAS